MPRPKSLVEASLKKKGFRTSETHHHYFIYRTLDGKKSTIRTKTSHTPKMKDLPDPLLGQMAKQCLEDMLRSIRLRCPSRVQIPFELTKVA